MLGKLLNRGHALLAQRLFGRRRNEGRLNGSLDAPVRRWVSIEDDHPMVLAHFEHSGCLGLAHTVALAEVGVDDDAHQAPGPGWLRATARRR